MLGFAVPVVLVLTKALMFSSKQPFFEKSLSAYYHTEVGLLFTGLLVAIGIALVSYRGYDKASGEVVNEDILGTIAGMASIGTGVLPPIPGPSGLPHLICTVVMFGIVTVFAYRFTKPWKPRSILPKRYCCNEQKNRRNSCYIACFVIMALVLLATFVVSVADYTDSLRPWVLLGESIGMVAFAVAWLIKGEAVSALNDKPPQ